MCRKRRPKSHYEKGRIDSIGGTSGFFEGCRRGMQGMQDLSFTSENSGVLGGTSYAWNYTVGEWM